MHQSKKRPGRMQAPPPGSQEPFGFHHIGNGVCSLSFETLKAKVAQLRGCPKSHSFQVAGPEGWPLLRCHSFFPSWGALPSHCTSQWAQKVHIPLACSALNGVWREFMCFAPRCSWLPTPAPQHLWMTSSQAGCLDSLNCSSLNVKWKQQHLSWRVAEGSEIIDVRRLVPYWLLIDAKSLGAWTIYAGCINYWMSNKWVIPEGPLSLICYIHYRDLFLGVVKSEVSKMCSMEPSIWAGGKQNDVQYNFSSLISGCCVWSPIPTPRGCVCCWNLGWSHTALEVNVITGLLKVPTGSFLKPL